MLSPVALQQYILLPYLCELMCFCTSIVKLMPLSWGRKPRNEASLRMRQYHYEHRYSIYASNCSVLLSTPLIDLSRIACLVPRRSNVWERDNVDTHAQKMAILANVNFILYTNIIDNIDYGYVVYIIYANIQ